ncbi:MAG: nucleotidyltransferase substrate binding protein [Desulfuromonadales bacterium]|nr:nucleotidyltransferase substrate binding protein [Desulfuromonadales bacterium]
MNQPDSRWQQRFASYDKSMAQLTCFIACVDLSNLENLGLIHVFENTCELAWHLLKDYLTSRGVKNIRGPRDAINQAINVGLIEDNEKWIEMLKDNGMTLETYIEEIASELTANIRIRHYSLLASLKLRMDNIIAAQ